MGLGNPKPAFAFLTCPAAFGWGSAPATCAPVRGRFSSLALAMLDQGTSYARLASLSQPGASLFASPRSVVLCCCAHVHAWLPAGAHGVLTWG
eukprot:2211677-Alexandrium_andersonii.AAC.1